MTIPKQLLNAKICNKDTCAEVEQLNNLVNSCQKEIRRLKERIDFYEDIESDRLAYIDELEKENKQWKAMTKIAQTCAFCPYESYKKENKRLNNVLNELKEWFKEFHKYHSRFKWNEEYYIEFIEHLENELKESDK